MEPVQRGDIQKDVTSIEWALGMPTVSHPWPGAIAVTGELDVATAPALRAALADPEVEEVVLAGVSFIGVAGLQVLLDANAERGRPLVLVTPSARVLRLLDLCGERDVFEIRGQ